MITALPTATAGKYVDWGVVHISVTNLVIIAAMVVVFVLAQVLPFPRGRNSEGAEHSERSDVTANDATRGTRGL